MKKVSVTLVKSAIDRSQKQKATLQALGLRKINQTVEVVVTPAMQGMISKVAHLVEIAE